MRPDFSHVDSGLLRRIGLTQNGRQPAGFFQLRNELSKGVAVDRIRNGVEFWKSGDFIVLVQGYD